MVTNQRMEYNMSKRVEILNLAKALGVKPVQPVKQYEHHRKHGALYYYPSEHAPHANLEAIARASD